MSALFNELKASLEEAVEIKAGKKTAARSTTFDVADVKEIREQLHVSQAEFAEALGTNINTIKSWESRRRNPTGTAAKVLSAIMRNPDIYKELAAHS